MKFQVLKEHGSMGDGGLQRNGHAVRTLAKMVGTSEIKTKRKECYNLFGESTAKAHH